MIYLSVADTPFTKSANSSTSNRRHRSPARFPEIAQPRIFLGRAIAAFRADTQNPADRTMRKETTNEPQSTRIPPSLFVWTGVHPRSNHPLPPHAAFGTVVAVGSVAMADFSAAETPVAGFTTVRAD